MTGLLLSGCGSADQQWRTTPSRSEVRLREEDERRRDLPLTEDQAWHLATECNLRVNQHGCGGIQLENETANAWFYRVLVGAGASREGIIVVSKRTRQAFPLADYPPGIP